MILKKLWRCIKCEAKNNLEMKIGEISITSMKAARISNFNSRMQVRPVYKTLLSKPYASLRAVFN